MAYSVVTTPAFEERLSDAVGYRVSFVGKKSALRLLDSYDKLCLTLSEKPLIGTVVFKRDRIPYAEDLRWVLLDSYVVIYHVSTTTCTITFEDMFYQSSNWRSIVKRWESE